MNEIWNIIEPYILTIVGALCGGSIIAVIARIICKRLIDKASAAYNLNKFATEVADKLGGKTLNIDVTAVTERRLKEIADMLSGKVQIVADETNSYKRLLVFIGTALTHLKMLSDEERAALTAAIRELDSEYKPPEKEVIATVKLEPINLNEQPKKDNLNTVNFG